MADINKTACRYAWSYPIIDIGRAELRNCCRTPFNITTPDDWTMGVSIYNNLSAIKSLKRDLLKGIQSPKCRTCWKSEEVGLQSPRTGLDDFAAFIKSIKWPNLTIEQVKEKLQNLTDDEIEELASLEHPEHIEISVSTVCDLKCVYCSHVFSTQWATEKLKYGEIKLHEIPKNDHQQFENIWWDWFYQVASKTVNKITFVGGEPLINDKFYSYINKLIDYYESENIKYVNFFVATNFNAPPKYFAKFLKIIDRISESKRLTLGLGLSFESTGEKNEFIRTGSDWNIFDRNVQTLIETIKDKNKISLVAMPAINTLSVSSLPDFANYIINLRSKLGNNFRLSNTHVTYPTHYSPYILTRDFIKYIDSCIDILKNSCWYGDIPENAVGSWISFTNYLETIKTSILNCDSVSAEVIAARKAFVDDIRKLTERRKLDFPKTFPEMMEFYNMCAAL